MTIGSLTRVLLHRWYLTLVVLALVFWSARGAWNAAEPQYETSTTFLVTPSVALSTPQPELPQGTQPGPSNPFSLSGGATTLAQTVSTALNTDTVQAQFLAPFPTAGFVAAEASSTSGSKTYFTVSATTETPDEGGAVLQAALATAAQQLLDVQRAVQAPDNALFIIIQSTPVNGPVESYPDRARAVGAIGLGGLAAGVVVIVVFDLIVSGIVGAVRRRREKKAAAITPVGPLLPPENPETPADASAATPESERRVTERRTTDLRDGTRDGTRDSARNGSDGAREHAGTSSRRP